MKQEFDTYLEQYSPSEDPTGQAWSDFAAGEAIKIIQSFSNEDWSQLLSSLKAMPDWKKELLPSSAGYGADKHAADILVALTIFESSDIAYEAVDILGFRGLREANFHNALIQRGMSKAEKESISELCALPLEKQSNEIKFIRKFAAGI